MIRDGQTVTFQTEDGNWLEVPLTLFLLEVAESVTLADLRRRFVMSAERKEAERAVQADIKLTRRQRQVVRLALDGKGNEEIAAHLGLKPQTVSVHLNGVHTKLGIGGPGATRRLLIWATANRERLRMSDPLPGKDAPDLRIVQPQSA